MAIKLNRKTINIKTRRGTSQVKAWVWDDTLAWHKNVSNQWLLTHVPTGFKVVEYYQGHYKNIRKITLVISLMGVDWDTDSPTTMVDRLKFDSPYDAKGFISLLLSDVIDMSDVLQIIHDNDNDNDNDNIRYNLRYNLRYNHLRDIIKEINRRLTI